MSDTPNTGEPSSSAAVPETTPTPETPKETGWRENAKQTLAEMRDDLTEKIAEEEGIIAKEEAADTKVNPPSPKYYRGIVIFYVIFHAILTASAFYFWWDTVVEIGIPVKIGLLVLLLQALDIFASFFSIGVDELAGISIFGRPLHLPETGPYLVPWWLLKLTRASRNYKDTRFPGPADKIFRISTEVQKARTEGDTPPEGMFRPIIVTTGEPKFTEKDKKELKSNGNENPLDTQLSVEIAYFIRYRPSQKHGGIFRIIRNLSGRTGDIDENIKDLIREKSEQDMKSVLSRLTPATIIENWDLVNEVFILKTRLTALRLGIDIDKTSGGLDDLNLSHETNAAQASVPRAKFAKTAKIIEAQGERERLTLQGEGEGNQKRLNLKGLADGYGAIRKELGVDGASVLASETTKSLDGKKTIIVGKSGLTELFGLVAAGKEAFTNEDTPKEGV